MIGTLLGATWVEESTTSVKFWVASGSTPFEAVTVIGYEPTSPSSVVPARPAVPSPLSAKVTSSGNVPVSDSATSPSLFWSFPGVVVTVNESACPTSNVALSADVIVGGDKASGPAPCAPA